MVLGQAMRSSMPMSAPPLGQSLHWGEVPVLGGGEDNGGRPSRTLCTHLTNPRRVRRGGGPAFRGRGGGRSHLPGAPGFFLLSRPGLPRLLRLLSAGPVTRGPTGTGRRRSRRAPRPLPGSSAAECKERLPPWLALAESRRSPSRLPAPTYLPAGRIGAMAGGGLARPWPRGWADGGSFPEPRSARVSECASAGAYSSGAGRKEAASLAAAAFARRAMSSWTAPRNMSICTTDCRSSGGGWG